jgi:DNA-binding XRE family transcriptional regulator
MKSLEFIHFRKKLNKTQEEVAKLVGVSVKAVRSYEQGWRTIPAHVQRQIMFLITKKEEIREPQKPCWIIKNCKESVRQDCPAWEFQTGTLCWFLYGTACSSGDYKTWKEKIKQCQHCSAFPRSLRAQSRKPPKNAAVKVSDENCFNQHE